MDSATGRGERGKQCWRTRILSLMCRIQYGTNATEICEGNVNILKGVCQLLKVNIYSLWGELQNSLALTSVSSMRIIKRTTSKHSSNQLSTTSAMLSQYLRNPSPFSSTHFCHYVAPSPMHPPHAPHPFHKTRFIQNQIHFSAGATLPIPQKNRFTIFQNCTNDLSAIY